MSKCLVLKSFSFAEVDKDGNEKPETFAEFRKFEKNSEGMYVVNKKTAEKIQSVIEITGACLKYAKKIKAVEILE